MNNIKKISLIIFFFSSLTITPITAQVNEKFVQEIVLQTCDCFNNQLQKSHSPLFTKYKQMVKDSLITWDDMQKYYFEHENVNFLIELSQLILSVRNCLREQAEKMEYLLKEDKFLTVFLTLAKAEKKGFLLYQFWNKRTNSAIEQDFSFIQTQPRFVGGPVAFNEFLRSNLKYPKTIRRLNIKGAVFVQFIVDVDGTVRNVEVIKGFGYGCDEEALKLVRNMPKFIPGTRRGTPQRVNMTLPIKF